MQKITIVPRTMGALGYVMHVPEEEKYLNSQKEIQAMLVGYLGGRAAEEIVFQSVTTGAANDIEQATRLARAMVTQYGMSEKFGLMGLATQQDQYLTGRTVMNCGDATAAEVDNEIMRILKEAYEEAKRLLNENREVMDEIAEFLIEKETITGKEFMEIFRRCKGIPEPEEKKKESKEGEESDGENEPEDGKGTDEPETSNDANGANGAKETDGSEGANGKEPNDVKESVGSYETDFTNEPDWKETEESNDFALQNGDNKSKEQTPWENQESENTSGWIKTK